MKKIILKSASAVFFLFLISGCGTNILFAVKSAFEVTAYVTTASDKGSIVDNFNVNSNINLTDQIDNVDQISDLQVTGVSLQLMEYDPHSPGQNGALDHYYIDALKGQLKITLLSNNKEKVLYDGEVDLGSNIYNSYGLTKPAPVVDIPITTTQAKDLIENKMIKLKIECSNGVIRDNNFQIKIVAKTEAISEI